MMAMIRLGNDNVVSTIWFTMVLTHPGDWAARRPRPVPIRKESKVAKSAADIDQLIPSSNRDQRSRPKLSVPSR